MFLNKEGNILFNKLTERLRTCNTFLRMNEEEIATVPWPATVINEPSATLIFFFFVARTRFIGSEPICKMCHVVCCTWVNNPGTGNIFVWGTKDIRIQSVTILSKRAWSGRFLKSVKEVSQPFDIFRIESSNLSASCFTAWLLHVGEVYLSLWLVSLVSSTGAHSWRLAI